MPQPIKYSLKLHSTLFRLWSTNSRSWTSLQCLHGPEKKLRNDAHFLLIEVAWIYQQKGAQSSTLYWAEVVRTFHVPRIFSNSPGRAPRPASWWSCPCPCRSISAAPSCRCPSSPWRHLAPSRAPSSPTELKKIPNNPWSKQGSKINVQCYCTERSER